MATLGRCRTTPRAADPVEREFTRRVLAYCRWACERKGVQFPRNDTTIITLPDGQTRTRPQLIENVRKSQGEHLRREAEAAVLEAATPTADNLGL